MVNTLSIILESGMGWNILQLGIQPTDRPTNQLINLHHGKESFLRSQVLLNTFPELCGTPKVHHSIHNSPLSVPILSQINPLHAQSYLLKIHFNIILPCTPRFASGFFPCRHDMAGPQVTDKRDVLQIRHVTANILNKQVRTAKYGWSSSWGLGEKLTIPHGKNLTSRETKETAIYKTHVI